MNCEENFTQKEFEEKIAEYVKSGKYLEALYEAENATKCFPNLYNFHFRYAELLEINKCYFKSTYEYALAIELASSKGQKKSLSMYCLAMVEKKLLSFGDYPNFIENNKYIDYIKTFSIIISLEFIPEAMREKYNKFKDRCILEFERAINNENIASETTLQVENTKNLCVDFLAIPNLNSKYKKEIECLYIHILKKIRERYDELFEDISLNNIKLNMCNTGNIMLESGQIVLSDAFVNPPFAIGVLLYDEADKRLYVLDAYAYENYSETSLLRYAIENKGWKKADSEVLLLLYQHKEEINRSLKKFGKVLDGRYASSDRHIIDFSTGEDKTTDWNGSPFPDCKLDTTHTRYVKEINLSEIYNH